MSGAVTPDLMRKALGHFGSGVCVVTSIGDGEPLGFTCQTLTSLSLDPPLVLICPARSSASWPRIEQAGQFAINILGADQAHHGAHFGVSSADKFAGVSWRPSRVTGSPVLEGVLAVVDCSLEAVHEGGDHRIVVGRVADLEVFGGDPLLYFRGAYGFLASD